MELCTFMTPSKVIKTQYFGYFGPYEHAGASGDMVGRFVSNSDQGGGSGAPVMGIFVSHVGPHFFNIGDSQVYEGIWRSFNVYGGYVRYIEVI